jgi:hypothetical protein
MHAYWQEQLDVSQIVPKENRVALNGATGNLTKIPKTKREYSRMLTHTKLP